ncbi:MAG: hypothetical protein OEV74_12685 [Cyclobacteriaceae bacterium]|jgi:hypothetical protein|nr:hypothetical protein [Cyclobacteriaceae bacterium]MDH4297134.1 hypothetical protein [Cyclobacteriaceae bacterium]MDH5247906.1 hypothetical protein [Cyclobacteriaceae bacterium]
MIRKLVVCTTIVTMALHSGYRMGILDQLYQKRHEIAFSIGIIAEIPIAMCNSEFDFSDGLTIETEDEPESVPQSVLQTREINLFFISAFQLPCPPEIQLNPERVMEASDLYRYSLGASIFHPPATLG